MNNNPLFSWPDIAGIVPKLLENLPVTLGITLASLALGWLGEPAVSARLWRC